VSGAFKEGKETVKGERSTFGDTGREDRFLHAYETVVIPSEKREVPERCSCVTDNAPHLNGAGVWGKGRFPELVEDRTAKGTKKGGASHELGDAGPLVWRAEGN
jgi:hypothetical protein